MLSKVLRSSSKQPHKNLASAFYFWRSLIMTANIIRKFSIDIGCRDQQNTKNKKLKLNFYEACLFTFVVCPVCEKIVVLGVHQPFLFFQY